MPDEATPVVTEEDLLKSIQDLEAKAADTPKTPKPPSVAQVALAKSTTDAILEEAAPETRRALDVSDVLTDLVGLLGKYNDDALGTMQKSINAGAERDLAMVKVLGDLKKSVDDMGKKLEKFGGEPRQARSATAEDLLHKAAPVQRIDPTTTRRSIVQGLEHLVKSLPSSDPRVGEFIQAAIKFESTGQIEDRHIQAAQKALAAIAA
jgi:hypothetical protein